LCLYEYTHTICPYRSDVKRAPFSASSRPPPRIAAIPAVEIPEKESGMGTWNGACHCGRVRFRIEGEVAEVITCGCSLCAMRNVRMAQVDESALTLTAGEDALALYTWNTGVAQHRFCRHCGVYVFHRKRAAPDRFGVNVECLEAFDAGAVPFRAAEGTDMSVRAETARPQWLGPREG
jgi:hypothetical protein